MADNAAATSTIHHRPAFFLFLCLMAMVFPGPATALQGPGPAVGGSQVIAEIERIDCPLNLAPGDTGGCLMAWLPMSYADAAPDGTLPEQAPRIGVHLVVLGNFLTAVDPDPLVVITGGPGQAGTALVEVMSAALELRRSRSIILVDQRGTGHSRPRLDCPSADAAELDGYPFNDPTFDPEASFTERMSACRDRLAGEGIDLSAFDSRAAALDLKAIRRGLGFNRWNLMGISYGARVVLDAMRIDPDGIRAAVLNSPMRIAGGFDPAQALGRARVFDRMLADCAADTACLAAFPHLGRDLKAIARHLEREPLILYLRDRQTDRLVRQEIDWIDVVTVLDMHLAFSDTAASVARYIDELARMMAGRLNLNEDEVARIFQPGLDEMMADLAIGMHLSARCREDFPFLDAGAIGEAVKRHPMYYPDPNLYGLYLDICPIWKVGRVDPAFAEPVTSPIATLILTGDSDTLTPSSWAAEIERRLPNARLLTFRGMGHDVFDTTPCARVITANFLDAPGAQLDAGCVDTLVPFFELEQD